jgi:hypothetical protein
MLPWVVGEAHPGRMSKLTAESDHLSPGPVGAEQAISSQAAPRP